MSNPAPQAPYKPKHTIRIVTAASLFDGHDAAINIMRRMLQATGVEVIHLGHNRSVGEIVDAAIQEDVQAVAITSYQGGHNEFFVYMRELLDERGAGHIKIFGGGGGTILPEEIAMLHERGMTRIYSPEDGRTMGLQGMINHLISESDFNILNASSAASTRASATTPHAPKLTPEQVVERLASNDRVNNARHIARTLTFAESFAESSDSAQAELSAEAQALMRLVGEAARKQRIPVLGITGTGGAGKSSLTDELVRRFRLDFPEKSIGILSIDPSKRKTGGALLGDRIRMNAIGSPCVFMRSVATRTANAAVSKSVTAMLDVMRAAAFDLIIVETAGIGQSGSEITDIADVSLYVMTPEFGAASQLEKIDMIDYADLIALNKFDKAGALDALRDVKKQFQRSHGRWNDKPDVMPVYGTIAAQFNDPGMNTLYAAIIQKLVEKTGAALASSFQISEAMSQKIHIIPPHRTRYLAEIADDHDRYTAQTKQQSALARQLYQVRGTLALLGGSDSDNSVKSKKNNSNGH
jgi:isobutyryl-CoA mutase